MNLMNFYGQLYTQFNHQNYEDIIKKPDLTLEELLDFEDIVQEFSTQDSRLINFFTIQQINSLINYATTMPQFTGDVKKAYKYPGIAADLLGEASNTLKKMFQQHPELMQQIFYCITTTEKVDPVIAGYFLKILTKHLQNNAVVFLNFFYQPSSPYQQALLNNICNPSIAQAVFELISMVNVRNTESDFFTQRKEFLERIFDFILQESDINKIKGATSTLANLLLNILNGEQNLSQVPQADQLMLVFYQNPKIEQMLQRNDGCFVACLEFITSVVQLAITRHQDITSEFTNNFLEKWLEIIFTKSFQILQSSNTKRFQIQTKALISSFGQSNYNIILQIQRLTSFDSLIIDQKFIDSSIAQVLFKDLVTNYEYNSFLHVELIKIVQNVLKKNNSAFKQIVEILSSSILQISQNKNLKGLGINLTNKIMQLQSDEHIRLIGNSPQYRNFCMTTLKDANKLYAEKPKQQNILKREEDDIKNEEENKQQQNLKELMTTEEIKNRSINANKKLMSLTGNVDNVNKGFLDRLPQRPQTQEESEKSTESFQSKQNIQPQKEEQVMMKAEEKPEEKPEEKVDNQYLKNNYWRVEFNVDLNEEDL